MNERQIRAADAHSLLNNPVFKDAIKAVSDNIERIATNTDPNNEKACAKVIQAKQILAKITMEIRRYIDEGVVEDIIQEKKTLKERVFAR